MGVLSVTENFTGLAAHDRRQPDGRIMGDMRRFFDVTFDGAHDPYLRPILALSDGRVPQIGQPLPGYPWIYVLDRRSAVTNKSAVVCRVVIQYAQVQNPFDEPPRIEWFMAATMEPVESDEDGLPMLTSSDEPYDPPPTEPKNDLLLRATYNVSVFDPVRALMYKGAINSDPFLGFEPEKGKVVAYTARIIRAIIDEPYATVAVEIQFRKKGWKWQLLDQGFRTKAEDADSDGNPVYATIAGAVESGEPVLLDGFGQQRKQGLTPVYRKYWTRPRLPFNTEFARIA